MDLALARGFESVDSQERHLVVGAQLEHRRIGGVVVVDEPLNARVSHAFPSARQQRGRQG